MLATQGFNMILGSYTGDMDRPFVDADNINRATLFPIPLALIARLRYDGPPLPASALKLFYVLIFIAWNEIATIGVYRPLAYDALTLKRAVRRSRMTEMELQKALENLSECQFKLPDPEQPHETLNAPLLDWHHVDDDRVFWTFSNPVRKWCSRRGSTYAELDLSVATALNSIAALRLYEIAAALHKRDHPELTLYSEELRGLLEVADGKYAAETDLTGKLLARAMQRVNGHANFAVNHAPRTPYAHRYADAHVITVTLRGQKGELPKRKSVPDELKQIRREDVRYVPLPSPDVYADFCRRPSAVPLPSGDFVLARALPTDGDESTYCA
jgi:hypothetical protein